MIGVYIHVKFASFGPGLEEKKEAKRRSIFARTGSHIVYLVMFHMGMMSCHLLTSPWPTLTTLRVHLLDRFLCVLRKLAWWACTSVHCMYIVHFSLQLHHRVAQGQRLIVVGMMPSCCRRCMVSYSHVTCEDLSVKNFFFLSRS